MTLQWTRPLLRNLTRRHFHTTKGRYLFYETYDKDGYSKKPQEQLEWEKLSWIDKIKFELSLQKEYVKEFVTDYKLEFNEGPRIIMPEHHVDVFWRFTGKKDEMKHWLVSCDSDHKEGHSTAKLEYTRDNKGLFHGFIDTKVPHDGYLKRTGWANIRMAPKKTFITRSEAHDFDPYTHIVFRVRGDGRVYAVNLHYKNIYDVCMYDTFHYFIWTRGGPYWQYVKIPFSRFVFAYKGRVQVTHKPVPKELISSVSFTLADNITGPFKLEIDYIGVQYDPNHEEESAYETYSFDNHLFW
ncbi:complex I intermediate-associated protein 30, mitochondrial [Copidosoma floridanum]|uniref:complex I intermediate-associated protein 30, mitochondrial n=1 Tax=Copidosoma floridanum TaxID=29053 RepID=UPI0006C9DC38|nr:complex I intermediate-associated protein 30, mitochondrial [Copidosoma floridanum]